MIWNMRMFEMQSPLRRHFGYQFQSQDWVQRRSANTNRRPIHIIPVQRLSLRNMYTYIAPIEGIEQALRQTEDDLLDLFERGVPVCGGVFPLETLEWLARNVLGVARALESAPTECEARMLGAQLHAEFIQWLAHATSESLLDAGAGWAHQDYWILHETNPMDLAGTLLDLGAICAFANPAGMTVWVYWIDTELGHYEDSKTITGNP